MKFMFTTLQGRTTRWLAALAATMLLTACTWKGGRGVSEGGAAPPVSDGVMVDSTGATTTAPAQGVWVARAAAMRVFPTGGLANSSGRPRLEVRMELTDDQGDAVKMSGNYRFELFQNARRGEAAIGDRLEAWEITLRTAQDQRQYYDPITRTYLFNLALQNSPKTDAELRLTVTFVPAYGARMQAQAAIKGNTVTPLP